MATFGSLFSGIGGMDLGLHRAGWECRWQVDGNGPPVGPKEAATGDAVTAHVATWIGAQLAGVEA